MGRLRKFDEDQAMAAIEHLFWEKGYEATSYADLLAVTGLGKGSLYAAFGNKHELYLKALETYVAHEIEDVSKILTGKGGKGEIADLCAKQRIEVFLNLAIEAVADRQDRRGCFICNAAVELAPFDPDVEKIVLQATSEIMAGLKKVLPPLKATTVNAESLFATYLGMRVMAKAGAPVVMLETVRNSALKTLD